MVCPPDSSPDPWRERWIQLNVGLVRHGGLALPAARALFDEIAPLVEAWRAAGNLRWFFFMRKPPDVRLRFLIPEHPDPHGALGAAIEKLQHAGHVATCFYSTYAPETERFGGPHAMRSVHAYFDADTRIWLRLDTLERQGRRHLSAEELLPALVQDLFLRGADGHRGLVAASWQNLADQIATPIARTLPNVAHTTLDALTRSVGGTEQECLADCAQANEALAHALTELSRQRRLVRSIPDVLASVALFSFHRHGFSGERSAPLVAAVMAALSLEARR